MDGDIQATMLQGHYATQSPTHQLGLHGDHVSASCSKCINLIDIEKAADDTEIYIKKKAC